MAPFPSFILKKKIMIFLSDLLTVKENNTFFNIFCFGCSECSDCSS